MTLVEAKASRCKSCVHMMKMLDQNKITKICLKRSRKNKCEYRAFLKKENDT